MELDYSPQYYSRLKTGSNDSAKAVVPVVLDLVRPKSVIDLGCGTGAWLSEFKRLGVADILGVDGPHIPVNQLEIEPDEFLIADLTYPLRFRGHFDLAVSLEVAEHLGEAQADQFVEILTQLAPIVLFSAAIPHQGGEHHLNEQWPAYWIERFDRFGFVALDPFRRLLWERPDVDWWYAQNLVLFIRRDQLPRYPQLVASAERSPAGIPTYIHPQNYLNQTWKNRVLRVAVDLATATKPGEVIVLADEDRFGPLYLPGRAVRPFVEHEGAYFGPPHDDADAIKQLKRMKNEGATYFAIGWPAFWWLTYYKGLARYLQQHHSVAVRNDDVLLYNLRP
jgi:SAM-dependent methyltransferase